MTLDIRKLEKAKRVPPTQEEDLLFEAAEIIQYFIKLTEFGPLQGNEGSIRGKKFFNNLEQYFI